MNRNFTKSSLLLFLFTILSGSVWAQFTVSGTITDDLGESLIGANVIVKGTTIGTITDIDGNYSIEVPDDPSTLVISYTGYTTMEKEVTRAMANSKLDMVMSGEATMLEELVITGLATNTKRANLANSVARINAAELTGIGVPATVDGALYGKFKGAEIRASSGAPGGGLSIRMRGLTSIGGSSQPLVIMDGVYIDNSSIPSGLNVVSAASGGGSTSNQDNPSNRLADIDPADIESVELLKGASAAAIYGSRAAGGVMIINTKRGAAGKTKVRFGQSIGFASMLNPLGVRQWTEEKVDSSGYADDVDDFIAARDAGQLYDYEQELFGNTGMLTNTRLSVSGGSEKTRFLIGGSYKNEEGIVTNTGYEKVSTRFNLDHDLTSWLDVSLSSNYVWSSADRGFFNNDNSGTTMGIAFTSTPSWAQLQPDENGIFPSNPYAPSNFLETAELITNNEKVNRFIGGGTINARLLSTERTNLKLLLRGGLDFYNLLTFALFPPTVQFQRDGAGLNGVSVQGSTANRNTNIMAALIHTHYLDSGLSFRTSVGATREDFDQNTILGTASNLISGQSNLDQGGARNVEQNRLIQKDRGFFAQEEINWDDKIIGTIGIRGDKSSNNGDANKLYFYPKANLAVNLHEFDFLSSNGTLSQLKARVAYGESGNFAVFGAKSTVFNSNLVDGSPSVDVPGLLGNSEVGPERQREIEFGFDAQFLRRFGIDFTYYIKTVDDLLLNAAVPTSSGFSSRVTNAAALENKGVEIGLNLAVLQTNDINWNARFSFWRNTGLVTRLDPSIPAFTRGGFADFLGQYLIKEGYSPTTVIGVGANPDIVLNEDDDPTTEDVPTLQNYGNAEPDFQLSWNNFFVWKDLEFSMAWHWKQGGKNINLSALLFDLNETTFDFDDTGLDPDGVLANGPYRLSQLGGNTEPYIENSGYIRLREVGLYYNLPSSIFKDKARVKLGVSGNNLINIFEYRSYDPEVSNFGANGLGVEVNPFPSAKRFDFHLIAEF